MDPTPRLETARIPLDQLVLDPKNLRKHGARDLRVTNASLERWGQVQFILVQKSTLRVIDGNGRVDLLRKSGAVDADVVLLDVTDQEARALQITLNRSAELAEWDLPALERALGELDAAKFDAEILLGWTEDELDAELRAAGLRVEEELADDEPPVLDAGATIVSRRGDVWTFPQGHRVMCGDSMSAEDIALLMNGRVANLVHTDPPYGVSYQDDAIVNDDLTGPALEAFLACVFQLVAERVEPAAAWYVWHASSTRDEFKWALKAAGLVERQPIVWIKPGATLGRSDYQYQHEPCLYACREGEAPAWYGGRNATTVWTIARRARQRASVVLGAGVLLTTKTGDTLFLQPRSPKSKRPRALRLEDLGVVDVITDASTTDAWAIQREAKTHHPTQKPLEVPARAIRNSTREGQLVLDPFLGSGSTLVAADAQHRVCYGMEIDPAHVDRIIRWMIQRGSAPPTNQRGETYPTE